MRDEIVCKFKDHDGIMYYAYLIKDEDDALLETTCSELGDENVPLVTKKEFMDDMRLSIGMILERVRSGKMHERAIAIAMELLL